MKKHLLLFIFILFSGLMTKAQLSGTYYIPGTVFPTLESAIVALNAQGVGEGGVTFSISAGYTETFVSSLAGVVSTTTSGAGKPIIFQKYGEGPNPLFIAAVGLNTSRDAIFAFGGTDYVTFDGINIMDRPTNSNSTQWMEFGIWLARASATDGTQHFTLKNCKIYGLKKNYAIYSSTTKLDNTSVTPTAQSGTNSYIKIFNDSLVNTNDPVSGNKMAQGVNITGSSSATTSGFWDTGNEIGVDGGNAFLNGMYFQSSYQKGMKVVNNLFSSIDIYAVGCPQHISTQGYDIKICNNTIGNFSVQPTIGYKAILDNTTDSVEITNNIIQNINHGSATTGYFTGIDYNTGGAFIKISGNSIINNTLGFSSTTTGYFIGISVQSGNMMSGSYCNVYDNIISGNAINSQSGSAVNSYIKNYWYGWSSNIYNNTITNNTASCTGTTHGIDARCITANLIEKRIYGNTISGLTNTNGTFYGIRHAYGLRTYVYKNKVTTISASGTSNPVLNGITVEDANTATVNVYNNYIAEFRTPSSSGTRQITGLNIVAGQVVNASYNTIYLDASSSGTDFGTAGIFTNTVPVVKFQNNIVDNVSVPAGIGRTVALYYGGSSQANFDPSSNNNNYYAGTPGRYRLIFYDGTNQDTILQTYQARVAPAENASISENTPFMDVVNSPYNMHINIAAKTQVESAGITVNSPVPITSDYYDTPRYPNAGYPVNPAFPPTRPDIGAEEFGGMWLDNSPPNIVMTPLPNTPSTTERLLTTTITDMTGVPTAGSGLPVLYWKINYGSWNAAPGSSQGSNVYTFSFGDGVALHDTIRYFIVSQDTKTPNPNIGSTPAGASGFTADPPSSASAPPTPFFYTILPGLCGTYNVGMLGDYTTLTSAVNDLNNKAISCPVTLLLLDASYDAETFPIAINRIPGLSATNTLTIKPAPGVTATIKGSNAISLITLAGANYVTIDGSNSSGTDRNLTLYNSNSTGSATVVYVSNAGGFNTASSNVTVKNCKIKASAQITNTTYGVRTNSTSGGGNNNVTVENNEIFCARIGVRIQGTLAYPATNCNVLNNIIGSPVDSLSIQLYGIYNLYADNTLIEGNDVMGPSVNGNANLTQMGISIYTLATNTKVRKNKVHGFYNNTLNYGAQGIQYRAEGNSVTEISNNVIYDIKGAGSAAVYQDIAGISVLNGGNVKIWNNSVNLSGNVLSSTTPTKSGCIIISNAVTNMDIRNNILKNSLLPVSGTPASKTYGIYSMAPASSYTSLDNNDYYITGIGPYIGVLNNTTDYATLASWQSATGKDQNAANLDPWFTSPSYLLPTSDTLNNLGVFLADVTTDITGATRKNPPDIGAYEFGVNVFVTTDAATGVGSSTATLNGTITANEYIVSSYFDYGFTTAYGNVATGDPSSITGGTPASVTASLSLLDPHTTYHFRARGLTSDGHLVFGRDMTFTTEAGNRTLNLKAYIEGLFSQDLMMMNKVQDCTDGAVTYEIFTGNIADTLTILLANPTDPWDYAFQASGIPLNQNGTMTISLPPTYSGNYYIVIKHRAGVETWSAAPVSFNAYYINYDFTNAAGQAFGNNQKNLVPESSVFGIYSGDVTSMFDSQDGYIDIFDNNAVFNNAQFGLFGYMAEDLNGDAFIDIFDMAIVFNNMQYGIGMNTPPNPGKK